MLANRVVKAKSEDSKIRIKPTKGCPQGGCLSPLLWCLVVDSLISELEHKGCHVTAYADDLALVLDKNSFAACDKMNEIMKVVENWCDRNQLHVNPAKTNMVRFTRCNSEAKTKMKQVKIFNEEIQRVESFKYLGVHLDSKMKMNVHVDECVAKGLRSLWAARSMVSRTWGLTPLTTSWLYKQVIIPRVTYGSIVWWHRAKLKTYANRLDKIHRLALLMISGATKSTPTLGMSAALEILPLNLMIEMRAKECYERLKLSGTWRECSNNFGHRSIASSMLSTSATESYDKCSTTWNFDRMYNTEIPDREEWNQSLNNTSEPLVWYSDGSKTDSATGCGVFCEELKISRSERLSDHSTVMQAETVAIKLCAEITSQLNVQGRNVFILSDSQAAIQAIAKHTITSNTVKTCTEHLNILGNSNNITISWVPGHSGIDGNEKADELANTGASLNNVSIITPIPDSLRASRNKEMGERLFKDLWNNHRGLNHSKMMMEPFKKGKRNLIKMKRKDLRVMMGILTGHSCLKKFLYRIHKAEDPLCRCGEADEDMKHLLTECPAFVNYRRRIFGKEIPNESDFKDMNNSTLLKYAKETELYGTFFRDD
jgi:ribonuclease HI